MPRCVRSWQGGQAGLEDALFARPPPPPGLPLPALLGGGSRLDTGRDTAPPPRLTAAAAEDRAAHWGSHGPSLFPDLERSPGFCLGLDAGGSGWQARVLIRHFLGRALCPSVCSGLLSFSLRCHLERVLCTSPQSLPPPGRPCPLSPGRLRRCSGTTSRATPAGWHSSPRAPEEECPTSPASLPGREQGHTGTYGCR